MAGAKWVIFTFAALGETGQTAGLAQSADAVAPTGQNFMRVRLMADIPNQPVIGGVEHIMQRHGQFDDAQSSPQMATSLRHSDDRFGSQFIGQLAQIGTRQPTQICW